MRAALRVAVGIALVGILGPGCKRDQPKPPAQPPEVQPPAASGTSTPEPESQPLRTTKPDPEALGVEGALPEDVPTPEGAEVVHPPMVASGATRASYALEEPIAAVREFYEKQLAAKGWSIDATKELDAQLLLSAKKDGRELSVAMSESDGRTQLVLLVLGDESARP
jgi:hypothetical protein